MCKFLKRFDQFRDAFLTHVQVAIIGDFMKRRARRECTRQLLFRLTFDTEIVGVEKPETKKNVHVLVKVVAKSLLCLER